MSPILVPTLDELGTEFDRCLALVRAADEAAKAAPGDRALARAAEEAHGALADICSQLTELPVQTLAHVQLKARALEWLAFIHGDPYSGTAQRLAHQLVSALVDGTAE